jgi:lipoprotein-releasing system ATP-binding protein
MGPVEPLLELKDVSKTFRSPEAERELQVLRGINLQVGSGESLAIMGASGSGKSTLLHIAGALDKPTAGQVRLAGRALEGLSETELAAVRNRAIGFVFQAHYLLPQCSVLENVLLPTLGDAVRKAGAAAQDPIEERAERLLKRVGLAERTGHRPGQLSGGERQRAAVVRALINQPKLLLADEPTGALDAKASDELVGLLLELNAEEKVALIVVTHAPEVASRMRRQLRMRDGSLSAA